MGTMSLRLKLLLGALGLALAPLLIAALIVPARVARAFGESGRANLAQTARAVATSADHLITQHVETVRGLAAAEVFARTVGERNAQQLAQETLAATNRQIGAMLKGLGDHYQGMWLCDASGFIFAGCLKDGTTAAYALSLIHI